MPVAPTRPQRLLPTLVLAIALVGCGGEPENETPSTVTVTEAATQQGRAAKRPTRSLRQRAEATVRRYYRAVDRGAYRAAWALLSTSLQAELGGYAAWLDGYDTTVSTRADGIRAIRTSSGSAVVELGIEATDVDACGTTVDQTFAGTWSLRAEGGRLRATSFDVEKTSGATPVSDPGACGYEEGSESPPPESEPICDPNYTGCVPVSSGDVDCYEVGEEVEVVGEDVYGLDLEGDGNACEIY